MFKNRIKTFIASVLFCSLISCSAMPTDGKPVEISGAESFNIQDGKDGSIILNLVLVIEQSVERVFAYLTNPDTVPEWQTDIFKQIRITDGPMRTGSRLLASKRTLWGKNEYEREVVDFVPYKTFGLYNHDPSLKFKVRYDLTTMNDGTQVAISAKFEKPVTGPYSLLPRWILNYGIKKIFLNHNRLLKLNIEKTYLKNEAPDKPENL